jgi:uncharacterized protein (TIGR03118 family)
VSGWRGALGTNAEVLQLADPSNSYKGLDVDAIGTDRYALLADFAGATIDVLKGTQGSPDLPNKFVDPALPAGYAPFNVQVLNGAVYVTYALRDPVTGDDTPGAGNGFVDKFDLNGNFLQRLVSGGALDSPWGLAIAPMGFGDLGGALLVGNFGDGHINAYNLTTGALLETLLDENLDPLTISGLWALRFGNGGNGGALGTLYFTAGPDGEAAGELGKLTAVTSGSTTTGNVPEPASLSLLAAGLGALAWARRR